MTSLRRRGTRISPSQRTYVRFLVTFGLLGALGLVATLYLLIQERAPLPFENEYTLRAEFPAANGIVSGIGQPVNVVGVKVGQVTAVQLQNGLATVTLAIQRGQLPHVYADASAQLAPITPLDDMEINLYPGGPPAATLAPGTTLRVGQTQSPIPLSDLLADLDGDTRDFLSSLIASLGQGFGGEGAAMNRMLANFGPTVKQAGEITRALASRRTALAELVHNVAQVTYAAARDHQLTSLVSAGDQTLRALADEDVPLRQSLTELPGTLQTAQTTLTDIGPFADQLGPTTTALLPAIERLPRTLATLHPFLQLATGALKQKISPLVTAAQPLLTQLTPAVKLLNATAPGLTQSFQILTYTANELAYDPGGKNQGFLFWLAWAFHNFDSVISLGDAHGGIGRAQVLLNCYGAQDIPSSISSTLSSFDHALGAAGLCPS